jgi:hypothetical protein
MAIPKNPLAPPRKIKIFQLVHRLPGRLRLSVPRLGWDEDYRRRLQPLIRKTRAIETYRINATARSLIVTYAPDTTNETDVLAVLEDALARATGETVPLPLETPQETNLDLNATSAVLALALLTNPLEIPLFLTGAIVLLVSFPLWQRIGLSLQQKGEITTDSLDGAWLCLQLLQGNPLSGALALNLGAFGENLRRWPLEKLESELSLLFERENAVIHWRDELSSPLAIRSGSAGATLPQQALETSASLTRLHAFARATVVPTLALSGAIGLGTGDLNRASALLPLDIGVTLRGTTPLAIVSALVAAARRGIYIRDGETLEKLSQVDTLVLSLETRRSLPGDFFLDGEIEVITVEISQPGDRTVLDELFDRLQEGGRVVAWLQDQAELPRADVTLAFARGEEIASADVILHERDFLAIGETVALARHTFATARESLAIALVPNLLTVGAGVIFGIEPLLAVAINGGAAILAELYSARTLRDAGIEEETKVKYSRLEEEH